MGVGDVCRLSPTFVNGGRNKAPVFEFYFLTLSKLNNPTFANHLLPPSWSKINYY